MSSTLNYYESADSGWYVWGIGFGTLFLILFWVIAIKVKIPMFIVVGITLILIVKTGAILSFKRWVNVDEATGQVEIKTSVFGYAGQPQLFQLNDVDAIMIDITSHHDHDQTRGLSEQRLSDTHSATVVKARAQGNYYPIYASKSPTECVSRAKLWSETLKVPILPMNATVVTGGDSDEPKSSDVQD